jgi:hypothetical protein
MNIDESNKSNKSNYTTLDKIRGLTIAHTDSGDFFIENGELRNEFYVLGRIVRARAGLFFIDIDGEKFTAHKKDGFESGELIGCIIQPQFSDGIVKFTIKGIEKISDN